LPDIDSIAGLWGTATYLEHHRGITHALIGVPILAALLAAVMRFFSGNFGRTYAVALIAMATHPLLDLLNPYGLRPFLPWNHTWYYGVWIFIFDPYLDSVLLAGLITGSALRRVRLTGSWAALVLAMAYVGARVQLHDIALAKVRDVARPLPRVEKLAALPVMGSLFAWDGVVQSPDRVIRFRVNSLDGEPQAGLLEMVDGPSSDALTKASMTPSAQALLRFARFPVHRTMETPEGYRMTFLDFRFYRDTSNTALIAEVTLDKSLNVLGDSLTFLGQVDED
jgi:inner membrane protein